MSSLPICKRESRNDDRQDHDLAREMVSGLEGAAGVGARTEATGNEEGALTEFGDKKLKIYFAGPFFTAVALFSRTQSTA